MKVHWLAANYIVECVFVEQHKRWVLVMFYG